MLSLRFQKHIYFSIEYFLFSIIDNIVIESNQSFFIFFMNDHFIHFHHFHHFIHFMEKFYNVSFHSNYGFFSFQANLNER